MKIGLEIDLSDLKAVFFVKSLEGRKDPIPLERLLEEEKEEASALKVKVTFHDGESLIGMTYGYSRDKQGFFMVPLEKNSNHLRIFVIFNSTREIEILK